MREASTTHLHVEANGFYEVDRHLFDAEFMLQTNDMFSTGRGQKAKHKLLSWPGSDAVYSLRGMAAMWLEEHFSSTLSARCIGLRWWDTRLAWIIVATSMHFFVSSKHCQQIYRRHALGFRQVRLRRWPCIRTGRWFRCHCTLACKRCFIWRLVACLGSCRRGAHRKGGWWGLEKVSSPHFSTPVSLFVWFCLST